MVSEKEVAAQMKAGGKTGSPPISPETFDAIMRRFNVMAIEMHRLETKVTHLSASSTDDAKRLTKVEARLDEHSDDWDRVVRLEQRLADLEKNEAQQIYAAYARIEALRAEWEDTEMLNTAEHYDLIDQFDKEFKGSRLDKEPKDGWHRGIIYQDGQVNQLFLAYRRGYALGKSVAVPS
jgi:hypothetical protein